MNERIRKLMLEADRETLLHTDDGSPYLVREFDVEKFAELIVRECMKLNRDILCEDDPDYLDQVYKEHFEVEE